MEKMEDYLQKPSLHPDLDELLLPPLDKFENVILYGAPGVGKYAQALRFLKRYSDHGLKYEKKVVVDYNDSPYVIKVSDVHFEVDMEQLGNTAKPLWHEIYVHVKEIANCCPKHKIVLCKNFHKIDQELLDIFYSYMQDNIKFILLTEAVSFIPKAVVCRCKIVPVPRPSVEKYEECGVPRLPTLSIKDAFGDNVRDPVDVFCDKLWPLLRDSTIVKLREELYNALVYDIDVDECFWNLTKRAMPLFDEEKQGRLLTETGEILRRYRNNYRPIYHLETFVNLLTLLLYV
jgi:hypothetical protein